MRFLLDTWQLLAVAMMKVKANYLLSSHEQEMLYGMGHARHVICIAKAADIDIDRRTGLVRFWIMDQQSFQLVWKPDDPVSSVIEQRRLQFVGKSFYRPHGGQDGLCRCNCNEGERRQRSGKMASGPVRPRDPSRGRSCDRC